MQKSWNFEDRPQELVAERPDLVAGNGEAKPVLLAGREVAVGRSGTADAILLDREGALTVVETKLLRNPDYDGAVGQAIRYRAWLVGDPDVGAATVDRHLSHMADRRFDGAVPYLARRLGLDAADAVALRLELKSRVRQALRDRCIRVAVVADAITPELAGRAPAALAKDSTLSIDLVELLPGPAGETSHRCIMEPGAVRRGWSRPVFEATDWEAVQTERVPAALVRKKPRPDRFHARHGHRVLAVADGFPDDFRRGLAFGRAPAVGSPIHQVDPSRPESCAPLMPCRRLREGTGMPFPSEPPEGLVTDDRYREFLRISRATWLALAGAGVLTILSARDDLTARVILAAAVRAEGKDLDDALRCISDTLRDLALWGMVRQERRGFRERRFTLKPSMRGR